MEARTYLAVDLKSFYASVECVERGAGPHDHQPCGSRSDPHGENHLSGRHAGAESVWNPGAGPAL